MFSFFRTRTPEQEFQREAEQALNRADNLTRMFIIMELVNQATNKRFYTAQIELIEKFTDWRNDPLMGAMRDTALLMRDGERTSTPPADAPHRTPTTKAVVACPQCTLGLSVPSGKRLSVTCPKCRASFSYGP